MDLKKFGVAAMSVALSVSMANAESFETLSVNGKTILYGGLSFRTATYHQIDFKDETDGTGSVLHTTGYNDSKFGLSFEASKYEFRYGTTQFNSNVAIGTQINENNMLHVKGRTVFDISDQMMVILTSAGSGINFSRTTYKEGELPTNTITSDEIGGYSPLNLRANSFRFINGSIFADQDLTVNGKITCHDEIEVSKLTSDNMNVNQLKAKDIRVDLNNAADYVFEDSYNLKSLKEVESYVKENKHLPGIPSAAEISQNGMSVSEMSNLLLEKVEELTLHLIQLEKENEALKAKVESLEK